MTRHSNRPQQRLERVRLGMAGFGIVLCLLPMGQVIIGPVEGIGRDVSLACGLAAVVLIALNQARGGRMPVVLVPVLPALIVLMGVGLGDRIPLMGACIGVAASETMYGNRRSILLRTLCLVPVLPLSVLLTEAPAVAGEIISIRNTISAAPVIPLFTGLIYLLRNTLESQAMTIAREGFMARVAGGLLASNTIQDVTRVLVQANDEFEQVSPGMVTLELRRVGPGDAGPEGGARLLSAHGAEGYDLPPFLPAAALAELPPLDTDSETPLQTGSSMLAELGLPARRWHAVTLERRPGAPCDLILHGVRASLGQKLFGLPTPEETEFLDVRRRIRAHWRSTISRMQARAALIEAAERDEATGLPDRATTMRRIVELVHTSTDRVGLILVEVAGLDLVEAGSGIWAVDTAISQLAQRVLAVVDGRGLVGRSGDSSFAVLLTDADSYDEVEVLVDRLQQALEEPVLLPTGPVQLGAGFGVSRTTTSGTAADLLERAVSSLALDAAGRRDGSTTIRVRQS